MANRFNWEIYKKLNPDLVKAGLRTKQQFERHYMFFGRKEGRKIINITKSKISNIPKMINNSSDIWSWNDETNTKPVIMTVALPALNATKIIWLALESLKNQTNIDFAWELICVEEEGLSRDIIKEYVNKLPGCVRIIHKKITLLDRHYSLSELQKQNCPSYCTLLEKWICIASMADKDSKIYVKHACDCYSPPKRLFIHYENFKNDMCYYSTQPVGYFYNILTNKWMLYNGHILEPKNIKGCHLNMALRTEIMKKINLPPQPKRSSIDNYILTHMYNLLPHLKNKQIVFTDEEVDKNNYKYSLDTDGYNNISLLRKKIYNNDLQKKWIIPVEKKNCRAVIPEYIMAKLYTLK
jgi:hypothetical protein